MNLKHLKKIIITTWLILGVLVGFIFVYTMAIAEIEPNLQAVNSLPDISGLAWIEENLFLGVHDAKNDKNNDKPRVSLIKLPNSESGLLWQPVNLNWPQPVGFTNDLEGAARIPDQSLFIVAESGTQFKIQNSKFKMEKLDITKFLNSAIIIHSRDVSELRDVKTTPSGRLFLLEYTQRQLKIIDSVNWPIPVRNVEGIAVAKIKNRLVFIYAERGDNQPNTEIRWGNLSLNPLKFGSFQGVTYATPELVEKNTRHVSAIEVDRQGRLYVASAFDPNDNNGPFYSTVWEIGRISQGKDNNIQIILDQVPKRIAVIDGFKVEGLAIKETNTNKIEIFIGTDDENYGGVVRPLPFSLTP